MEKIKAKPISDDYWVLQLDNKKVGQVIHSPRGYSVKVNGQEINVHPSLKTLKADDMLEFIELSKPEPTDNNLVHGYPTDELAYNAVWNLQYNLPLFTYTDDSKSWYAAGYYKVIVKGTETIEFCPKLITLQRNKYDGPHVTKPELLFDQLIELT